ncbi:MAG TPA: transcription/translation regulatory transformer protein RfaH [Gammaproteobacteria bacterium]|nr:transcription/translation regulatory transformer protein RfaH [Gammaproteobacteria bacterium]
MSESDTPARWYVIQSRSRQAQRAEAHLRNQAYETFLPRIRVEKIYRSKRVVREEPLLPNYLFIRLRHWVDDWRPIRSTRGVLRLVGFGGEPAPVADGIVEEMRRRVEAPDGPRPALEPGQAVTITEGPFRGLDAIFHAFDGNERVVLFLSMLQQQVRMTLPLGSIRRA